MKTILFVKTLRILLLWASNAINLQFGMFCPKHGQKKPRFHIKDRIARFGHMRATQTRIRLSVGTGVTGMLYSAQV